MGPFEELVDQAPDGVVILAAGCVVYMNQTAARLLGVTHEQALGQPIGRFLPPEDAALAGQRIGQMMATGEELTPSDYGTLADPDRVVEIKAKRWTWEGRPAVLAFARDVTERKAMARQLVHADRLAAIGTLAAGVAHEINNPLTYVQLSLQLIEASLKSIPGASAVVEELLHDATQGVERVAEITRALRAFARPSNGATGPTDAVAAVDAALRMVDNDLRHRARLVRTVSEVPPVTANAPRLEQVVVNLLLNAIQSLRGREGDTITVDVSPRSPNEVAISVRDTGCGMSGAIRARIFDPFFTTKPVGDGMGLGLSVSRTLIDSIGGKILVDSTEDVGTTMTLVLPAHSAERTRAGSPVTARANVAATGAPRRRILLVDDEQLVRTLLADLLAPHHDVASVDSGPAALSALEHDAFDVVLCDVMMPTMTGVDVYRHVAATWPGLEQRFIFITGGAFTVELENFLARSGNPVLSKPFQLQAVLGAIAAVRSS
jgi:PAS domain S-box-containing protein